MNSNLIQYGISAAVGALYAILFIRGLAPVDSFLWGMPVFLLSCVLLAALTFLLARRAALTWAVGLFVLVGICGGVFTNAIVDDMISQMEKHNLFPLEIILVAGFAMPGVITGLGLVWLTRWSRRK